MLFAVHLSDGVVTWPWLAGGWAGAILLVLLALRGLAVQVRDGDDSAIPRLGVMTAAFFVSSLVHLPLGGVSVHLLLNGLVGLVLGVRAPVAIAIGLAFQALFFAHGGLTTLGLNTVVVGLPALLAGALLPRIMNTNVFESQAVRGLFVSVLAFLGLGLGVLAVQSLWVHGQVSKSEWLNNPQSWWVFESFVAFGIASVALTAAALERTLERDPRFPLGLLLGAGTAGLTVGLNCFVLTFGAGSSLDALGAVVVVAHLPVICVEAVACGLILVYLAKVKPEWVGVQAPSATGTTSSNGTSH